MEEGDWMEGGGVYGWQKEEKQVKTGTGAGRVEEVGKMGGWRKWGVHAQDRREGPGVGAWRGSGRAGNRCMGGQG